MNEGFKKFLSASEKDRADTFLAASQRLGANAQYIEKDFWVCWTLDVLYHGLPAGGPRLLFKGTLRDGVSTRVAESVAEAGHVELDDADPDGQTLLVFYPSIVRAESDYTRPAVRIECGAKSALDPHGETTIRPYIADDVVDLNISVPGVTTIEPARSFWDKAVITHGLRRWFEIRGELRQEGQRISRHYYDMHCLLNSAVGGAAVADRNLAADCVRHARLFFNRPDFDLLSARPGSWAIEPNAGMMDRLRADYDKTIPMIFGGTPTFDEIMASVKKINDSVNKG